MATLFHTQSNIAAATGAPAVACSLRMGSAAAKVDAEMDFALAGGNAR